MKKVIYILLGLLFVETSYAQQKKDSLQQASYLGVFAGVALPLFDYSSKNASNNAAGFAKPGLNFEATFTKVLIRETGIVLMYRYQLNSVDGQTLLNQYTYKYPSINWSITTTPWKVNAFMGGLYHSSRVKELKGVSVDFKAVIGMIQTTSPRMLITGQKGTSKATAEQLASNSKSFAYGIGLGLKFEAGKYLYIIFQADYLGTNAKFTNVTSNVSSGSTITNNFSQKINTANICLGLAYKIN